MTIIEKKCNLFSNKNCYYAHCISDDFAMGAGIAVEFDKRYHMRSKLRTLYPNGCGGVECVLVGNVFNLITKEKYWQKPTYKTLTQSLVKLAKQVEENNIYNLAIPKLGCGLDKLNWNEVKNIIIDVFKDINVNIIVCYL